MSENDITRFKRANQTQLSDTTRRFGYSGGTPMMLMDAAKSGLDCNPIEGGRLLLFTYNPKASGYIGAGADMFSGQRKKQYVPLYPHDYQIVVERAFHLNDDLGYRNLDCLTPLKYEVTDNGYFDMADEYFKVVHPVITECSFGLNRPVQLSDPEVGASTPVYQACPTCRINELKSDACSERIYEASKTLDSDVLAELRAMLIEANQATLTHVERKHTMVLSDIARKMTGTQAGRNVLNTVDRVHLKMLHRDEMRPEQSGTVEMMKTMAAEMASAFKSAAAEKVPESVAQVPEGAKVLNTEEAAEYELYQTRKAQMAKAREAKNESKTGE